jgi:antitoxin component of MazEF toxin-antitoxin module
MNKRESKALEQGGSVTVVLPADWVRGNHIKPGDTLIVEYSDAVVVRPLVPARGIA